MRFTKLFGGRCGAGGVRYVRFAFRKQARTPILKQLPTDQRRFPDVTVRLFLPFPFRAPHITSASGAAWYSLMFRIDVGQESTAAQVSTVGPGGGFFLGLGRKHIVGFGETHDLSQHPSWDRPSTCRFTRVNPVDPVQYKRADATAKMKLETSQTSAMQSYFAPSRAIACIIACASKRRRMFGHLGPAPPSWERNYWPECRPIDLISHPEMEDGCKTFLGVSAAAQDPQPTRRPLHA